ncbi:MAG TPA: PA14 domain-containing protein [Humisphaera sp.]
MKFTFWKTAKTARPQSAAVGIAAPVRAAARRAVAEKLEGRQLMADVGGGLVANYYADPNFQNLALARTDATVDFNWGTDAPAPGVPAEGFSVRWSGQVAAPASGTFKLLADSAGGVRVTVDGKTVIDDWSPHARRTKSADVKFTAGQFYDLKVEYVDQGSATARLLWAAPTKSATVVPQESLYRLGTAWVSDGWITEGSGSSFSTRTATGTGGSFRSTGDVFTISSGSSATTRSLASGTGSQIAYKMVRDDGEIVAKLVSTTGGATADVVFRDSLDADATYVDLAVTGTTARFEYRTNTGGAVESTDATSVAGLPFVKVKRDGNSFAAYASATGADDSWQLVGTAPAFMDSFAHVGFAVGGGSTTLRTAAGSTASFSSVRVVPTKQLGGNLTKTYDSSTDRPFVDLVKLAHTFQTPTGKSVPQDAQGWPTQDFQVSVAGNGNIPAGKYTITFTGPAGVRVTSMRSAVSMTFGSYDAGSRTATWYANVPANQPNIGFRFLGTGGQVKKLRVLQPGYSPVNTPTYTTTYLNFLKSLSPSSIRFMDWMATNESTNGDWAKRSTADTSGWVHRGVSWESAIELCNLVGANMYVNVPGRADDNYVRNLAALIKAKLRSDLNVYVEYGNEMWATNFANGPWAYEQSLKEVQAAKRAGRESDLNYDHKPVNLSQTNLYAGGNTTWELRRTARRGKQISDIFKSVFGPTSINSRVRVVVAAQIANTSTYDTMLNYINAVYGNPGNYFYTMAGAPYFTMREYTDRVVNGKWTTLNKSLTKDQILSKMADSSGAYAVVSKWQSFWRGKQWGIRLSMYEGGHDTFGPFNIAAKAAATLDPRMKTLMKQYLNGFFAAGGTAFHYFTLGSSPYNTPYGTWAITPTPGNLNTPKAQAFKEVRAGLGARNVDPSVGVFG